MNFWFCFTCPGKFCELLPGDLEGSAIFVEGLIDQALKSLPLLTIVGTAQLNFLISEHIYIVRINIQCYGRSEEFFDDLEAIRLEIEACVSQALLQCFWEVHYAEY